MNYVGIDNGVSGTIGIVGLLTYFTRTPVKSEQNYTKKKGNITRVDVVSLRKLLDVPVQKVLIERPFVNPKMFQASLSAIRAMEATIGVLESLNIPFEYIDSKEWQKELLPKGTKGTPDLKKASMDIGCRLFPQFRDLIVKHGDADGLLIAEYCRIKNR